MSAHEAPPARVPAPVLRLHREQAPWQRQELATWRAGGDAFSLERFRFAGPAGGGDVCRVAIFAGIHGDEVGGVHAAVEILESLAHDPAVARGYELFIYPLCNPSGFAAGTRHSRSGRDLNREFWQGSAEPEVRALEQEIRTQRFDGMIALHADGDSPGLYAFALGAQVTQDVVEPALHAAERILPRNCDAEIDNFTARNGLIRKGYPGMLSAAPETSPQPFEIVFETPLLADLGLQIKANLVFVHEALDRYLQLRAIAQDL